MKTMKHLIFGKGKILINRGVDDDGRKYIFLNQTETERPIGSNDGGSIEQFKPTTIEQHDVVLEFQSLESARVLADSLNLLVSRWSEEQSKPWDQNS